MYIWKKLVALLLLCLHLVFMGEPESSAPTRVPHQLAPIFYLNFGGNSHGNANLNGKMIASQSSPRSVFRASS